MVNLLTFKYLRELQKKEKESRELEQLENDFYEQVAIYMGRKMNLNIKNNSEFSSGRDLEHTKIIIKDILNRRERKVINIAMLNARGNVIPKNILPEEKELFEKITNAVTKYRSKLEFVIDEPDKKSENVEKLNKKDKVINQTNEDNNLNLDNKTKNIKENVTTKDNQPSKKETNVNTDTTKLKILDSVPSFVGGDGKDHGPFKKDDEVVIPASAARILVRIKKAIVI